MRARSLRKGSLALALALVFVAACASGPVAEKLEPKAERVTQAIAVELPARRFNDSAVVAVRLSAARWKPYALPLPSGRILVDGYVLVLGGDDGEEQGSELPPDLVDPFEQVATPGPRSTPVRQPLTGVVLPSGRVLTIGDDAAAVWDPESGRVFERIEPLPPATLAAVPWPKPAPTGSPEADDRAVLVTDRGLFRWEPQKPPQILPGTEGLEDARDVTLLPDDTFYVRGRTEATADAVVAFAYEPARGALVPFCGQDTTPEGPCKPAPPTLPDPRGADDVRLPSGNLLRMRRWSSTLLGPDGASRRISFSTEALPPSVVVTATGGVLAVEGSAPEAYLLRPDVHPTMTMAGAFPRAATASNAAALRDGSNAVLVTDDGGGLWRLDLGAGRAEAGTQLVAAPSPPRQPSSGRATRREPQAGSVPVLGVSPEGKVVALSTLDEPLYPTDSRLHVVDPLRGGTSMGSPDAVLPWPRVLGAAAMTGSAIRFLDSEPDGDTYTLHTVPLTPEGLSDATPLPFPIPPFDALALPSGALVAAVSMDLPPEHATRSIVWNEGHPGAASRVLATLDGVKDGHFGRDAEGGPLASVCRCRGEACELALYTVEATALRPVATTSAPCTRVSPPFVLGDDVCVMAFEGAVGAPSEATSESVLRCARAGTFERRAVAPPGAYGGDVALSTPRGDALVGVVAGEAPTHVVYDARARAFAPVASPLAPRREPMVVALADGAVLVAGGETPSGAGATSVEAVAVPTLVGRPLAPLREGRRSGSMTMLADGRIVVAGGFGEGGRPTPTTELRARNGDALAEGPALGRARARFGAAWVPGDHLVLAGGEGGDAAGSIELWDANSGTVTARGLEEPRVEPCVVRLSNGDVLVAGGLRPDGQAATSLEAFDARTLEPRARASAPPLGVCRSARVSAERWLFFGRLGAWEHDASRGAITTVGLPGLGARALTVARGLEGGVTAFWDDSVTLGPTLLADPFSAVRAPLAGSSPTLVVSGSGAMIVVSGDGKPGTRPVGAPTAQESHLRVTSVAWLPRGVRRPVLQEAPSTVLAGRPFLVRGARFTQASAAFTKDGAKASAPPVVLFRGTSGALLRGLVRRFDDGSLEAELPATRELGPGWLHVIVDGVPSEGAFVTHEGSPGAAACAADAECRSGVCSDGVCCDRPCTGSCVACSRAKKGGGEDGVCEAVSAGTDPKDACPDDPGNCRPGVCDGKGECARHDDGFVCAAAARCIAGICTQDGPPPPDRCTDDGTALLTAGRTVSCGAFRCKRDRCATQCTSRADCQSGHYCGARGACEPVPSEAEPTSPSCSAAPGRAGGAAGGPLLALGLTLLVRGRRRRGSAPPVGSPHLP